MGDSAVAPVVPSLGRGHLETSAAVVRNAEDQQNLRRQVRGEMNRPPQPFADLRDQYQNIAEVSAHGGPTVETRASAPKIAAVDERPTAQYDIPLPGLRKNSPHQSVLPPGGRLDSTSDGRGRKKGELELRRDTHDLVDDPLLIAGPALQSGNPLRAPYYNSRKDDKSERRNAVFGIIRISGRGVLPR